MEIYQSKSEDTFQKLVDQDKPFEKPHFKLVTSDIARKIDNEGNTIYKIIFFDENKFIIDEK